MKTDTLNRYFYFITLAFFLCVAYKPAGAQTWNTVGSAGFSAGPINTPSIATDGSGTPYVAYSDQGNGNNATVMKFNGSSWVNVGSPGFSAARADFTTMAIDGSGTPYVAYMDWGYSYKLTVMKYDGSSWVNVGSPGFSTGQVQYPTIAIDGGGTPYVAYSDGAPGPATVMKFNGSSWVTVGSAGFSTGPVVENSIAIDGSGTPYVVYSDGNPGPATVKKFDGSSWVTVGSADFSAGVAGSPSIAIDASGTPYVGYEDYGNSYKATVMKYNGSSWVAVGSAGFTPSGVSETSIAIDGSGKPYLVFEDGSYSGAATVMEYNGSSWVAAGSPAFSGVPVTLTTMTISGTGTLYVAYADGGSTKATVMSFGPTPPPITGTPTVCIGGVTSLTDITAGGTWSSGTPTIASVGSTGIVSGIAVGTAVISYTATGGTATQIVTVNTLPDAPSAISGTATVCAGGATTSLSDITVGGIWSSVNPGIASTGTSGVVSGIAPGTTTISYTLTNSCGSVASTVVVTVNPLPTAPSSITGPLSVCQSGGTIILSDGVSGGIWTSTATGTATAGSVTGIITGIAAGTATISYTTTNSCGSAAVAVVVTVNPLPSSITGNAPVCAGFNVALTDATTGGTWSSSVPTVATVGGSGIVSGLVAGTSFITYTSPANCIATTVVTVNLQPGAILGAQTVCFSTTTILSDAPTTGTWSSSNTAAATVGSATGIVSAVGTGTSVITYLLPDGCFTSVVETVNPLPASISGTAVVCVGSATDFSDATPGGTWSSGSPTIASAGTSGTIFGLIAGTSNIKYTAPTGCIASQIVTVNFTPGPILGTSTLCVSSTTILSDAPTTGTWSSSNTLTATIGSATGIITGTGAGIVGITYTLPDGCYNARLETLNPLPNPISGSVNICTGATATVSDSDPGGTWASSATTIASISTAGVVTGLLSGTSIISYTLPTGCKTVTVATVNSSIGVIAGAANICTTQSATLSDTPAGGTWSSSNPGVVTIGSSDGLMNAISAGTAVMTYTMPTGCYVTRGETVSTLPENITGIAALCAGTTTSLTDATAGGNWSSGSATIATVGTGGLVSGLNPGTVNISYSMPGGCAVTAQITVNVQPGSITGPTSICITLSSILGDSPSSGTWSSNTPANVVIGASTGIMTALAVGTAVISYVLPDGCFSTLTETVNPEPAPISGVTSVCQGFTTALSDASGSGVWNSASTSIATVNSSGLVSGISTGTTNITLTVSTGCRTVTVVTVNLQPGIISGSPTVCALGTTILGDLPYTGTWISGTPGVATIVATTGILTGASAGTSVISYILPEGCFATLTETVNPLPSPIFGVASVCEGFTTALTDTSGAGVWNSTSGSIATVNSSGLVSGISTGTTNITFTVPTGCITLTTVTVNLQPGIISGSPTVCALGTTILGDLPYTGNWSSGTPGVATIGATTGVLTAASAGTTVISYVLPAGCFATLVETVNPLPAAITGTTNVCVGLTTNLTDSDGGGTWSATSGAIATISTTGAVSGVAGGTTTITYTLPTGCKTTTPVTVNIAPGAILGAADACISSGITLSDLPFGGSWSSGSTGIATIDPVTGNVVGVAIGTTVITYALATGCLSTTVETVNPLPAGITGTAGLCAGDTIALSDGSAGGTWNSASTLIATVGSTGVVTGVNTGTTTISYVLPTGCSATTIVTINTHPGAILGSPRVCVGVATILSDLTTGGVWTSSSPGVATVGTGAGFVTGISAGTTAITYQMPGGCGIVLIETVNPVPAEVTGIAVVCQGFTTALSDITPGGTWSAGVPTIAAPGSTGIVTGFIPGITSIVYTLPTSCKSSVALTVNPQPAPISGPDSICDGTTVILSDPTHSGFWSSGTTAVATIGNITGILTAASPGTVDISYTLSEGCFSLLVMTVNALPAPISGTAVVCQGSPSTLSDATLGGTWNSQAVAVATINPTTGAVTALESGTTVIAYSLPDGCSTTVIETVNPLPQPITGTPHVCVGVTTVLGDISHDGVWTSSNTGIATVGAVTGIVTGVSEGIATITFTLPTGCFTTQTVTDSCDAGVNTISNQKNDINIFPNPNNGTFTIKGSFETAENGEVFVDIREMTGRVVYSNKLVVQNGTIDKDIQLENTLANGMYLLTLHTGNENAVFHFVIMK